MPSIAAIALHSLPKELPPPTCTRTRSARKGWNILSQSQASLHLCRRRCANQVTVSAMPSATWWVGA